MSSDPEIEYFGDGIAEEIINVLARLPGLRVAGRSSAFSFKGKHENLRVIGDKLAVASVLEGSVRKAGAQLRITAQLVNVADGYDLWSERFDRGPEDVFAIQEEIARTIADRLQVSLTGSAAAPHGKPRSLPPLPQRPWVPLQAGGRHLARARSVPRRPRARPRVRARLRWPG